MKAGKEQVTAKMASFVKIKLKDNGKSKKARTPDPESTHSLEFEDSGVHVDEPLTPLSDLDPGFTLTSKTRSQHVVTMETDLGCADLQDHHEEEDVFFGDQTDLNLSATTTRMAPDLARDFHKQLNLSFSQSPCGSPNSTGGSTSSQTSSPMSPGGDMMKLKQPPIGRINKYKSMSPPVTGTDRKFFSRNLSIEEVQRSLSNPCAVDSLESERDLAASKRPVGLMTFKEREAKHSRLRNLLRPLRRSHSAGCSQDNPAYTLFLKHELDKERQEREKAEREREKERQRALSDRELGSSDAEARKSEQAKKRTFNLGFLRRRHTDSALASKLGHGGEKGGKSSAPTPETLVSWAKSFSSLLRDRDGLNLFKEFLSSEFSQENIEFWIACEEYKGLKAEQLEPHARRIFDEFIAEQAPKQINLEADMRRSVALSMSTVNRQTFENAQRRIQALMAKDSYPRFLESRFYTDLLGHRKH